MLSWGFQPPFEAEAALGPDTKNSPGIRIPDSVPMPPDPDGTAIRRKGKAVFLLRPPEGRRNGPQSATRRNLCLAGIPDGSNFHDFPTLSHPLIFSLSPNRSLADTANNAAQVARWDPTRSGPPPGLGERIVMNNS